MSHINIGPEDSGLTIRTKTATTTYKLDTEQRFREIKDVIKERNPEREITHEEVLSHLMDVWEYHENHYQKE